MFPHSEIVPLMPASCLITQRIHSATFVKLDLDIESVRNSDTSKPYISHVT